jgi:MurNAc alpha-1-phosphate uridylyltransferase
MKAMIFSAGMGTRLKPFTDKHPKALAMVNDKSLLQRNIEYLKSYGLTDLIINVHHFAEQIEDFLKEHENFGCTITISDEREELLETGGGLLKVADQLQDLDSFLVMNADILTNLDLKSLIYTHNLSDNLVTLAVTDRESSRYLLFNRQNILCGWKNTKTGEVKITREEDELIPKAFSGIHIINPKIFSLIKQSGKFSIIDTYLDLSASYDIKAYDHSCDVLIDVGKPEAITKAEKLFS